MTFLLLDILVDAKHIRPLLNTIPGLVWLIQFTNTSHVVRYVSASNRPNNNLSHQLSLCLFHTSHFKKSLWIGFQVSLLTSTNMIPCSGWIHIVDRFSKWVICIPTNKSMTSTNLCDVLYDRVFSWVGLPESIVGDRDSRLTAGYMRALKDHLKVKLKLSAYRLHHGMSRRSGKVLPWLSSCQTIVF